MIKFHKSGLDGYAELYIKYENEKYIGLIKFGKNNQEYDYESDEYDSEDECISYLEGYWENLIYVEFGKLQY